MNNDKYTYNHTITELLRGHDINVASKQDYRLFFAKRRRAHSAFSAELNLYTMRKNTAYRMNIHKFLSLFSINANCTINRDLAGTFPLKTIRKFLYRYKDVHGALNANRQGVKYHLLMHADGFGILFFYSNKRMRRARGYKRSTPIITVVPLSVDATNALIKSLSETEYRPIVERWL